MYHSNQHNYQNKYLPFVFGVITAAPIILYFTVLWQYASNTPEGDDYLDALFVIGRYTQSDSWFEKLSALAWQYQEHSQILGRLVYLPIYWIRGEIDFQLVIYTGNFFLCCILVFLWLSVRQHGIPSWCIPVASLFIFSFYFWDVSFWPAATVLFLGTILLAFACFYFVDCTKPRIFAAVVCCALSVYSLANGLLTPFIASLIIIYNHFFANRPYKSQQLWIWFLAASLITLTRLTVLHIYTNDFIGSRSVAISEINFDTAHLLEIFASIGAAPFALDSYKAGKIMLGATLVLATFPLLMHRRMFVSPAILGLGLFCTGSLMAVVLFRNGASGTSAYQCYTVINIAVLFCLLIANLKRQINGFICAATILIAALFNLYGLQTNIDKIIKNETEKRQLLAAWLVRENTPEMVFEDVILNESMLHNTYKPLENHGMLPIPAKIVAIDAEDCKQLQGFAAERLFTVASTDRSVAIGVSLHDIAGYQASSSHSLFLCGSENYQLETSPLSYSPAADEHRVNFDLLIGKKNIKAGTYTVYWVNGDQIIKSTEQLHIALPDIDAHRYDDNCQFIRKIFSAKSADPLLHFYCSGVRL